MSTASLSHPHVVTPENSNVSAVSARKPSQAPRKYDLKNPVERNRIEHVVYDFAHSHPEVKTKPSRRDLLLFVCRQTIGFCKWSDQILTRQQVAGIGVLNCGTGRNPEVLRRARRDLRKLGALTVLPVPGRYGYYLGINIEFMEAWLVKDRADKRAAREAERAARKACRHPPTPPTFYAPEAGEKVCPTPPTLDGGLQGSSSTYVEKNKQAKHGDDSSDTENAAAEAAMPACPSSDSQKTENPELGKLKAAMEQAIPNQTVGPKLLPKVLEAARTAAPNLDATALTVALVAFIASYKQRGFKSHGVWPTVVSGDFARFLQAAIAKTECDEFGYEQRPAPATRKDPVPECKDCGGSGFVSLTTTDGHQCATDCACTFADPAVQATVRQFIDERRQLGDGRSTR